jgi:hypothetical protein
VSVILRNTAAWTLNITKVTVSWRYFGRRNWLFHPHLVDVWLSGGIAPRIVDLRVRWRWAATLGRLCPQGKSTQWDWVADWVGMVLRPWRTQKLRKISFCFPGIESRLSNSQSAPDTALHGLRNNTVVSTKDTEPVNQGYIFKKNFYSILKTYF